MITPWNKQQNSVDYKLQQKNLDCNYLVIISVTNFSRNGPQTNFLQKVDMTLKSSQAPF